MYYQYLSNTGYSNGYEMPTGTLKGYDIGLANPTPYTRTTMSGGKRRSRRFRRSRLVKRRRGSRKR
jgi:hypothetical protein